MTNVVQGCYITFVLFYLLGELSNILIVQIAQEWKSGVFSMSKTSEKWAMEEGPTLLYLNLSSEATLETVNLSW